MQIERTLDHWEFVRREVERHHRREAAQQPTLGTSLLLLYYHWNGSVQTLTASKETG